MKILFLSNLYPPFNIGGYELICESVNRAMRARGHETLILTSNHRVGEQELSESDADIRRTLRIHGFFGHPWLGISKLKGLEFHNNSELRRAVKEFAPDVIHVFNLGGISKSLIHTIERLGVPALYFVSDHWLTRSLDADVWLNWWNRKDSSTFRSLARLACEKTGLRAKWDSLAPTKAASEAKFRQIYFCSHYLRDKAVHWGRDVAHGAVIHNSVDLRRFDGEPAVAAAPCERLLFAGRLNEEKGIMTVLRALQRLGDRFAGTLTVCGRGDDAYEGQLRAFVADNGLHVKFVSASSGEMPAIYKAHDALVFASEWGEPFALTPLEAMACGLPVISTTTGGSAELFRNRENALTFQAGSDVELAQQIMLLCESPELRRKIAVAGREQVRKQFAEEQIIDRIEAYVRETVETRNKPVNDAEATQKLPLREELIYA